MAKVNIRPDQDERFIYIAHRHWVALLIRGLFPALFTLGSALVFVLRTLSSEPDFFGQAPPLLDPINLMLVLVALISFAIIAYIWLDWRNDHLIISNKRIIHEDRTLWLSYIYETIPLEQIQNVNVRMENVFQYTLKYGRIDIQAAGPTEPIVFLRVERPAEVQRQILGEVQREKRHQEERRLAATIARRLDPQATVPLRPPPPISQRATTLPSALQSLLPFGPIIQNGIVTWHRHWIVLLKNMIVPIVAFLVWLLLLYLIPRYGLMEPGTMVVVLGLLLVVIGVLVYWQYEDWRNDIYVLEPSKIIDIQRLPFGLYESRREATLGVIQNVNARSPNVIAKLLGYGDVLIETAGAAGNFTFDNVPDPDQVQRIVFEYRERFKWQQREREWNNTLDIVELYQRMHQRGNSPQP
ncbi:MAG TPA: PH domain-containing protein [Herpetosiphonaceae bacterium]